MDPASKDTDTLVDYDFTTPAYPPNYEEAIAAQSTTNHQQQTYTAQPPPPSYEKTTPVPPSAVSTKMVVVAQPTVVAAPVRGGGSPPESWGHIAFSSFIFCFCCWPLGLIAFYLAVSGGDEPNAASARPKLQASTILNVVGLVLGIIIWIYVLVFQH